MVALKSIEDINLKGKKVIIRLDLNLPFANGEITNFTRLEESLPSLNYLLSENAKIIVISHLGRPNGIPLNSLSLSPIAPILSHKLNKNVIFVNDTIGSMAHKAVNNMNNGEVVLLENLRFCPGEENNDPEFSRQLSELGEIYINDAFSCAHRAHSSIEGITHYLHSAAGLLFHAEIEALNKALKNPKHPLAAIIGGSKISSKITVLKNLVKVVDFLIIGGAMANTFLFANGLEIGNSLFEKEMIDAANTIKKNAKQSNCEIILPNDALIATKLASSRKTQAAPINSIPKDHMILDLGPKSCAKINSCLLKCKTVIWNGPLGAFEIPPFDAGTNKVSQHVAFLTLKYNTVSVAGGGDTIAALDNAGVIKSFSYVSKAGGAFIEWLEGKTLPGITPLLKTSS